VPINKENYDYSINQTHQLTTNFIFNKFICGQYHNTF
jgi:hypothetical protein